MKKSIQMRFTIMLFTVLLTGCPLDFSNPMDPDSSAYEGFLTITDPADIVAQSAWATPTDGSAEPCFVASRILGASLYQLQVADIDDFSGTLLVDVSATTSNSIPVPGLIDTMVDGTTYYWRVSATKDGLPGPWSPVAEFTVHRTTGISIGSYDARGNAGSTGSIQGCTIEPADATCPQIQWSSSDPGIVSVDAGGKLRFLSPGSIAVITATTIDGGFTDSVVVSVNLSASASTGFAGSRENIGWQDGIGLDAQFDGQIFLCHADGWLYATNSNQHTVRAVNLATREVTTLAGSPYEPGYIDGSATEARFNHPTGICTDGSNVYIADQANWRIRRINLADGIVSTLAGSGDFGNTDGAADVAQFTTIRNIHTDGLYIYVTQPGAIRKVAIATGQVTTLWQPVVWDDPDGMAVDGTSLYFTSTSQTHSLYSLNLTTGVTTELAGTGGESPPSIDGLSPDASFTYPADLCTDGTALYITEHLNTEGTLCTLRKFDATTGALGTILGPVEAQYGSIIAVGSTLYLANGCRIDTLPLE
ncbi:MAG: hypothetical protein ABIJ86_01595 [Spirochaetota bacterium]